MMAVPSARTRARIRPSTSSTPCTSNLVSGSPRILVLPRPLPPRTSGTSPAPSSKPANSVASLRSHAESWAESKGELIRDKQEQNSKSLPEFGGAIDPALLWTCLRLRLLAARTGVVANFHGHGGALQEAAGLSTDPSARADFRYASCIRRAQRRRRCAPGRRPRRSGTAGLQRHL